MGSQRKDTSGSENLDFCPPAQGSLEGWLGRITEIGAETVELDGRSLPRVREPTAEPWLTLARSDGFEQAGLASADELARFVLEAAAEDAVLGRAPEHPGANLRICMEVSYARWIEAQPLADRLQSDLADYLGFTRPSRERSVRRVTRTGDELWAARGAWPWALFADGRLHRLWRRDPLVASELAAWHAGGQKEAMRRQAHERGRLRRARRLSQPPPDEPASA